MPGAVSWAGAKWGSRCGRGWSRSLGCPPVPTVSHNPLAESPLLGLLHVRMSIRRAHGGLTVGRSQPRHLLPHTPACFLSGQHSRSQLHFTAALPVARTFSGYFCSSFRPRLQHCFRTLAFVAPTAEQGASSGLVYVPLRPVSGGPGGGAGGSEPIQVGLSAGLPVGVHRHLAGEAGAPEGREHGLCHIPL